MKIPLILATIMLPLIVTTGATADITQIIDTAGDGFGGHPLDRPRGIAVDDIGNAFVAGGTTDNVYRIQASGAISQVVGPAGDGTHALDSPFGVACDRFFVWVSGTRSDNVFRDRGASLQLIDSTGDGMGNPLDAPYDIAVARDNSRMTYVAGGSSDNAFSMTFDGSEVQMLIDATGDGTNPLDFAFGIDVDLVGNVYVTGVNSNNAFRITPGGMITQIIDATGDGANPLTRPFGIAVSDDGTAYVTGTDSDNAFRIDPDGTITQIIDSTGGGGGALDRPFGIAVDSVGNVYIAGSVSDNVFLVQPGGTTCVIVDRSGDGTNALDGPEAIATDSTNGDVYVSAPNSDNAFRITDPECLLIRPDLVGSGIARYGDIQAVLMAWGDAGGPEDLDHSGVVDVGDLVVVLSSWGPYE